MTAAEARALNDKFAASQVLNVESINAKIRAAASRGETDIKIALTEIAYSARTRAYNQISNSLRENGYSVERKSGQGSYQSSGYDYMLINWA